MNIIEFIGFIVSIGALFFLFVNDARKKRRTQEDPEYAERVKREEEEVLRVLLGGSPLPERKKPNTTKKKESTPQPILSAPPAINTKVTTSNSQPKERLEKQTRFKHLMNTGTPARRALIGSILFSKDEKKFHG